MFVRKIDVHMALPENGEYKKNGYADVPTHRPGESTSSQGALCWPPTGETSFDRCKGWHQDLITTPQALASMMNEFVTVGFNHPGDSDYQPDRQMITRIQARAVVDADLIPIFTYPGFPTSMIESLIPLSGCGIDALNNAVLVYLGHNHQTRIPDNQQLTEQKNLVESIFLNGNHEGPIPQLPEGVEIRSLSASDRLNPAIITSYANLYAPFGYDEASIREMNNNPDNTIIGAFATRNLYIPSRDNGVVHISGGQVMSSAVLEAADVPVSINGETHSLRIVEITDAATFPELRGAAHLYTQVADSCMRHLATEGTPHLVYGEGNLKSPAVLRVIRHQGRRTAFETSLAYGLPNAWCLKQSVYIKGKPDEERPLGKTYNNLMPAWLTQTDLLQRYGN